MKKILFLLLMGIVSAPFAYSQNPFSRLFTVPGTSSQNRTKSKAPKQDYSFLDINYLKAEALTPVKLAEDDPNRWMCGSDEDIIGHGYNPNSRFDPPYRYPDLKFSEALYEAGMNADPVAQDKLGFCYKYGTEVSGEYSHEKAALFFKEAYKNGFMEASLHYAAAGYGLELAKDAASKNYAPACMYMFNASDAESDMREYAVRAARLGYPQAFVLLGRYAYDNGRYREAVGLLEKALDLLKDADPYNPRPVEKAYRESKEMYLKSKFRVLCESDKPSDVEEAFIIARYSFGVGAKKDGNYKELPEFESVKLVDVYNKFAQAHNTTELMNFIIHCMLLPLKDEMELYKLRQSIELLAAQNDVYALYEAGICNEMGIGMAKNDNKKAIAYYKSAHEHGMKFIYRIPSLVNRTKLGGHDVSTEEELYSYLHDCFPIEAERYKRELAKEALLKAKRSAESKSLRGKWRYANQTTGEVYEFTFFWNNRALVSRTCSKTQNVKDQMYRFNSIIHRVDYTMKHVCDCEYWVLDGKLYFTNTSVFELESLEITNPSNPNDYVRNYINEYAPAMDIPLISLFSEISVVVDGRTLEVTRHSGNKEIWEKIQDI